MARYDVRTLSRERFEIDRRPSSIALSIGRFILPKKDNAITKYDRPFIDFLKELQQDNADKGMVLPWEQIFLPYVKVEQVDAAVDKFYGRSLKKVRKGSRNGDLRDAKYAIRKTLTVAKEAECEKQKIDVEQAALKRTYPAWIDEILDESSEGMVDVEDPGCGIFGEVELRFLPQPKLIDQHTVGLQVQPNEQLTESYNALAVALRNDSPFDIPMDRNGWEPIVPIFRSNEPISDLGRGDLSRAITIPRPDFSVMARELKVTEF